MICVCVCVCVCVRLREDTLLAEEHLLTRTTTDIARGVASQFLADLIAGPEVSFSSNVLCFCTYAVLQIGIHSMTPPSVSTMIPASAP